MVKASIHSLTNRHTKANGSKMNDMELGDKLIQRLDFTMVHGQMVKEMDRVLSRTSMAICTLVNG